MAVVDFPRVAPMSMTPQLQTDVTHLRGPYSPRPVQSFSRGISFWIGTLTWDASVWRHDLDDEHNLDDIAAFLDSCEGGIHDFDLPLHYLNQGRADRFPSKDETDAANSVIVTGVGTSSGASTQIGSTASLILDTPAGPNIGLRRGDWISLRDTEDTPSAEGQHRGAYRVVHTQVDSTVIVTPKPLAISFSTGERHRLLSRMPTLRAHLSAPPPAISYSGAFAGAITIEWEASA